MTGSALYEGTVWHTRLAPRRHAFRYRVFTLLLDLDELPALDRRLRLLAHNRPGLLAFHDRDHGDGQGDPRGWVERTLADVGVELGDSRVRVLCYPRVLGYVFNPLSVWFVDAPDGTPRARLYEVSNTFGGRRTYAFAARGGGDQSHACAKDFYVSPFLEVSGTYRLASAAPGAEARVTVDLIGADGPLLRTGFAGRRHALTDRALAGACLRHPLLTLKVIGAIHWQALRLWRKGIPVVPRSHDRGDARPTAAPGGPARADAAGARRAS